MEKRFQRLNMWWSSSSTAQFVLSGLSTSLSILNRSRLVGFCTDGTASDVDVDVWPLWSFLSGSGWFCSFCLSHLSHLSHLSPSLCLSFWLFPHNVQQGMTLQRIENIENQIDLFSSFSSFSSSSSSSSSSFSCQLFQGHRNPHSKIEEPQLQSCQAMSSLIFCFGWLGFFLFVILNVWGQPEPQLASNQMNPNEMINIHDENKRWHCGTKYSQFVLCLLFLCLNMLLSRLSKNNRKNKHHEVSMRYPWGIHEYHRVSASHLGFHFHLESGTRHYGTMALWHYEQHLGLCFNVFKMSVNLQTVLTKISLQPWPNQVVLGTTAWHFELWAMFSRNRVTRLSRIRDMDMSPLWSLYGNLWK